MNATWNALSPGRSPTGNGKSACIRGTGSPAATNAGRLNGGALLILSCHTIFERQCWPNTHPTGGDVVDAIV
eukprot:SAG22_NODE_35_length_27276_cov_20.395849_1_plen_72_part_00